MTISRRKFLASIPFVPAAISTGIAEATPVKRELKDYADLLRIHEKMLRLAANYGMGEQRFMRVAVENHKIFLASIKKNLVHTETPFGTFISIDHSKQLGVIDNVHNN